MPYFIEQPEGQFEFIEGDLVMKDLDSDVVCAYVVSEKISRTATFKRESLAPKAERRFRCKDGQLRTKSQMGQEDLDFLKEKMVKTRAARGKATS